MQYLVFVLIQVCQGWEQKKKRRVPGLGRNHFHQPDGANNSTFWCCVASGLCMAAWCLPKSRGISTRDVLCFGEGRKPSAPAAVQQHAVGRGRNLVCRFLVWMHRHLSGQFIRHTNFREFPRLLAEACGGQSTGKADRSAQLDARALQEWLEHEIRMGREACVREVAHNKCGSFVQQWVPEVRRAVPSSRFLDRAGKEIAREHKLL